MGMIRLAFTLRFIAYTLSILLTAALLLTVLAYPPAIDLAAVPLAVFAGFAVLGTRDLIQTRHAVLRNYPISAHLRFLVEQIRPEMRQYFFEDEKDGRPFSRDKRAVVYKRAKMVLDKRPFGTRYDVYAQGFEWVRHSMMPRPLATAPFRVRRAVLPLQSMNHPIGLGAAPQEEDTNMRKSIIASLTLCAAMGAGHAHAFAKKPVDTAHRHPIAKAETAKPAEFPTQFRIPAHPLVYDCVHVSFPQCSRGLDGLNDGSFRWRW